MAKRELLFSLTKKDFVVETFCSGGPGGQHQNKTQSGVRIRHPASGAVGESREQKSQHQNKKIAFERLVEHAKFKVWHASKCKDLITGKTIDQVVEEMMVPENLRVEVRDESGKWVEKDETNS